MPVFLVERYEPQGDEAAFAAAVERAVAAAEGVSTADAPVECLCVIVVPTDETAFVVYEAPSSEAALTAARRAGLDAGRVVEAIVELAAHRR